ncbi:MAG: 1-deoxy-D-xylulose-5-phosphate reductoisomerase [Chloroflexota bacterium]|nr:1-deoxy-D-xylulose-5-phosphate reductoisomerase [Chloroflexota bacterium]
MKKIVVLGSTGSIGRQTLDIVRAFPEEFDVVGLAAGVNHDLFHRQVAEFHPRYVFCIDPPHPSPVKAQFLPMEEMVCLPEVEVVMAATTGAAGLVPILNALGCGKAVALSNKEPIVMAGPLLKEWENRFGGVILPVDSEPSAIWQCLQGESGSIRRLIITASGGPFRTMPLDELESVTPEQALRHPTWQMGPKITIDSATLMNKAFEVIESHWLFDVPWQDIEVVIHPQSTIHSMVEFADGSVKAQMGPPSMRLPIQYALFYPQRLRNPDDSLIPRLDTGIAQSLEFRPMEPERYPCFTLALSTAQRGGAYPAVLSAADEVAVNSFLQGKIGFTDIHRVVETVVDAYTPASTATLEDLLAADQWATREARRVAHELV